MNDGIGIYFLFCFVRSSPPAGGLGGCLNQLIIMRKLNQLRGIINTRLI
jgi:hypothetical protein